MPRREMGQALVAITRAIATGMAPAVLVPNQHGVDVLDRVLELRQPLPNGSDAVHVGLDDSTVQLLVAVDLERQPFEVAAVLAREPAATCQEKHQGFSSHDFSHASRPNSRSQI